MSIWSLAGEGPIETIGPIPGTTQAGPLFTCGIDTKGAWVQLSAGLARPSAALTLHTEQWSAGNQRVGLDIGIGAPASEIVVLPDLLLHGVTGGPVRFDLALPAGVPISIRGQATGVALTARAAIYASPAGRGATGFQRWTNYGATMSGATAGVVVDAGAVANTLSGWAVLSAATTFPIRRLHLLLAGAGVSGNTSSIGHVDIGIGAAAAEVVVLDRIHFRLTAAGPGGWGFGPYDVSIPTGSRLVVRHQSNSNVVLSSRNMHWCVVAAG